jgi:hypothetical protein
LLLELVERTKACETSGNTLASILKQLSSKRSLECIPPDPSVSSKDFYSELKEALKNG